MRGMEPLSYRVKVLAVYWCKQKCRWCFKAAWATWMNVSWKYGTVEQWNLVHIQMGPLRGSSQVHANSISRGAYYQTGLADRWVFFPLHSMINTEQDLPVAVRPTLMWGDECDWVNAPRSLYCMYRKWWSAKIAVSDLMIYYTCSLYTDNIQVWRWLMCCTCQKPNKEKPFT